MEPVTRESNLARLVRLTVQWEEANDLLGDPTVLDLAACPMPPAVEEACRAALHPAAADVFDALGAVERWNAGVLILGALYATPSALGVAEERLYGGPLPPLPKMDRNHAYPDH